MTGGARSLYIRSPPRLQVRRCTHAHPRTQAHADKCTHRQVRTGVLTCTQAQTCAQANTCSTELFFCQFESCPVSFALSTGRVQGPGLALARTSHALEKTPCEGVGFAFTPKAKNPPARGLWSSFPLPPGRSEAPPLPEQRPWCGEVCN